MAQSNERMLIYSKSGEVLPYRVEHIDSIKFLTNELDLTLNPTVTPHADGTTGKMKIKVGDVGGDVRSIKVIIPESYMIAQMNAMQCLRLFTPEMAARMGVQIFNVEGGKKYDLSGLQRGYTYTALFLPYDEIGCAGNVKRIEFTVPNGKLADNPKIEVNFSDITTTGYTATLTPNDDVKGYFFLNMETNDPTLDQMMQMMRIPDLKHYIVQLGADFKTRKPHEGVQKSVMTDFKPGTSYTVYVVLIDADGQYSDVQKFTVTTEKKGTSETAQVSIKVKDITKTEATVVNTPDANTSTYRETIIPKSTYNEADMIKYLQKTPDNMSLPYHSDEFTQTCSNLKPGSAYYAIAMAKNADGEWGPLTKVEFTTLSVDQAVTLPLAYLAEYNVNAEGTDFVTTQDLDVSGYFSYENAVKKFTNITIAGKKYHLPSKEEWMAIVPVASSGDDYLSFTSSFRQNDVSETVVINGESISSTNDYRGGSVSSNKAHALRFKGTKYVSAWRYESMLLNDKRVLKITVRPLDGKANNVTVDDIAKPEFWESNTESDIVRILPASGSFSSGKPRWQGTDGSFWSSTAGEEKYTAWAVAFDTSAVYLSPLYTAQDRTVRLFAD
ncbi:MAG: hypothetical protein SOW36_03960 [Porphyromonas sp.]|uniref:hypothetical protein n=1 Tax=Porphyromonas sp. TaxID=1924944 RepID=UPI002A755D94|nr:hypothetical protein [Porphyromonas sp.]MDY3111783.1 hypothetical protein [Porphyromonas sp.]